MYLYIILLLFSFINQSFQSLRSAEGAFDMLHNFKNIRSRDTINATMMKKFNEILTQFEREVENISQLFLDHKDDPPISRNQPPVAGAISWSHSLFMRIKHTVLRFQTMKELIDSEAGKSVREREWERGREGGRGGGREREREEGREREIEEEKCAIVLTCTLIDFLSIFV